MGYYSSLDIELNGVYHKLSAIQDALDKQKELQVLTDHELIIEALFALINERKEVRANYEDLLARIHLVDTLVQRQERKLQQEASAYVQLSFLDSDNNK